MKKLLLSLRIGKCWRCNQFHWRLEHNRMCWKCVFVLNNRWNLTSGGIVIKKGGK